MSPTVWPVTSLPSTADDAVAAFEATASGRTVRKDLGDQRRLVVLRPRHQHADAGEAGLLAAARLVGGQERRVAVVQAVGHAAQHHPIRMGLLRPVGQLADH